MVLRYWVHLLELIQIILQPLVADRVISSDFVIEKIKNISTIILTQRRYPVSLDVVNMYHNIPRNIALQYLNHRLQNTSIDLCSLPVEHITELVAVCLDCNHFKHNHKIYFQKAGLPMGNRLSGILSELFMEKLQDEVYAGINVIPPTYRYVDDLLLLTKSEEEAKQIHLAYNGLKFTLELPVNDSIPFLDFKININEEGMAEFDFYRKPQRKDVFINAQSALPTQAMSNIIRSEWGRIKNRCTDMQKLSHHNKEFQNRLRRNGHSTNALRFDYSQRNSRARSNQNQEHKFFLNIPFISNNIEHKIKQSLKELNVKIHIAHRGSQLKHVLSRNMKRDKCDMARCQLKNDLCLVKGAAYCIKCNKCNSTYIGSSWRHLHTRYKEHHTQRSSPIYVHNTKCNGHLTVQVLASDRNTQMVRIKEAILIKEKKPTLNVKDDLFRSHILFE